MDVTLKNRLLENEVRELKQRVAVLLKLATAVEHSPISVMITDRDGAIEYVNPRFCQVTGYLKQEVIGKNPRFLKGDSHPQEYYRFLWRTILSGREWRGEFHNRNKDGSMIWELASISPIRNELGEITHFVGVKEDIGELKRLQDELRRMAHADALTGLPNRPVFFDRLEQVMIHARRNHLCFALLYLDLDGFKKVNDDHGHQTGDRLLQEVSHRLTSCIRESDTVARLGGDEFVVILNDIKQSKEVGVVARKILHVMAEPFSLVDAVCNIGVSIGISVYPYDGNDIESLILSADLAMYETKKRGKNNFRYSSNSYADSISETAAKHPG